MMKTLAMFLLLAPALVCVHSASEDELEELRNIREYHEAMAHVMAYHSMRLNKDSKEISFLFTVVCFLLCFFIFFFRVQLW